MDVEQKEKDDYPVMLSICVPTYNHEKYIRECLESIFMQKTKYSYEILVGEDKSTDNTRSILKEIEKEGHYGLKVFYRDRNLNNSECRNSLDLMDKSRGKYLIFLEGDDYWTDSNKVESQIRFLENNLEFIAVAHNCFVVDDNSKKTDERYDECYDEEYTWEHYASDLLPGQTATVMMRNPRYIKGMDISLIRTKLMPGDKKMNFILLCYGKIYCIQKKMSAYRHIISKGDSWSAKNQYDYKNTKMWHLDVLEYANEINLKKPMFIADFMLYAAIRQAIVIHRKLTIKQFFYELTEIKHPWKCTCVFLVRDINRYVLHKRVYFPKLSYRWYE